MNKVIVIAGPTASGKTAYAIQIAEQSNGEIVSADSMQIYKYMDIGTAKPTSEEMRGISHYMLDVVSPLEDFSVVKYQTMAKNCIDDILRRGKTPIVCGGTGLYINSLMRNISYADIEQDIEFRNQLHEEANTFGNEYLYNKLLAIDPAAAEKIHMNNTKRVIRALEVYEKTGVRFSKHMEESMKQPPPYDFEYTYLDVDREQLYERINKRVDIMLEIGLIEETKWLYENGYLAGTTASMGICYKELLPYVKKLIDGNNDNQLFTQCVETLKQSTRNYAKRQITWFRNQKL